MVTFSSSFIRFINLVIFSFQLDVYKSDFEMERQARQDIANEREELLSDLKLLQRRNQQLIDEAQSRYVI